MLNRSKKIISVVTHLFRENLLHRSISVGFLILLPFLFFEAAFIKWAAIYLSYPMSILANILASLRCIFPALKFLLASFS